MDAAKSEISRTRMCGDIERGKLAGPDGLGNVSVASYGPAAAAAAAAGGCAQCPSVANMVVTKSSRVHIGPKFITVTQNATNNEVIRGRLFAQLQRARCHGGVLVCVCWACVLATAMCALALHLLLPRNKRLDIEVSLWQFLAHAVRTTSPAERLGCAAAAAALMLSAALAVYFTLLYTQSEDCLPDIAPHEWFITRDMWLAQPFNASSPLPSELTPPKLVIINHSVSTECHRFIACAAELRNLQDYFIVKSQYDIPYNFLIGNDGRVYEGRGWGVEGAHTRFYNKCSIGIGFIGDYRQEGMKTEVSSLQINRTFQLLEEGVRGGWLAPAYRVVGARDLQVSASPGDLLYRVMQTWERYAGDAFRGLNCTQIASLD